MGKLARKAIGHDQVFLILNTLTTYPKNANLHAAHCYFVQSQMNEACIA